MRRFVVGLLATLGFLTLLTVVGSAVFLYAAATTSASAPAGQVEMRFIG